jgi:hypothetical protein
MSPYLQIFLVLEIFVLGIHAVDLLQFDDSGKCQEPTKVWKDLYIGQCVGLPYDNYVQSVGSLSFTGKSGTRYEYHTYNSLEHGFCPDDRYWMGDSKPWECMKLYWANRIDSFYYYMFADSSPKPKTYPATIERYNNWECSSLNQTWNVSVGQCINVESEVFLSFFFGGCDEDRIYCHIVAYYKKDCDTYGEREGYQDNICTKIYTGRGGESKSYYKIIPLY